MKHHEIDKQLIEVILTKRYKIQTRDFKILLQKNSTKVYLDENVESYEEIKSVIEHIGTGEVIVNKLISDIFQRPSDLMILRIIKRFSPVDRKTIENELGISFKGNLKKNFLKNTLDDMRRKDLILYEKDCKKYIPTFKGLKMLPHEKNSNSSDIERALELGKRKW